MLGLGVNRHENMTNQGHRKGTQNNRNVKIPNKPKLKDQTCKHTDPGP